MAPVIEISEGTFRRLQSRGTAFIDTPESVICRLLDQTEGNGHAVNDVPSHQPTAPKSAKILNAEQPGELRHTKVMNARFGSRIATKWNELLVTAHAEALRRLGSIEKVKSASVSSLASGKRDDSGFHFQPELGFSLQYVDSNNAWKQVLHLAKRLGEPVEVTFLWREKEGAAFPGEMGTISWTPASTR